MKLLLPILATTVAILTAYGSGRLHADYVGSGALLLLAGVLSLGSLMTTGAAAYHDGKVDGEEES